MIGTTSVGIAKSFRDALKEAPSFDIDFLEVTCEYPHCHPEEMGEEERREIRDFAYKNNLSLSVHSTFSEINLAHINPGLRRECIRQTLECIKFANDIGALCIVVHPGEIPLVARFIPQEMLSDFGIEDPRSFFHSLSRNALASLKGEVKICVENMPEPHELCLSPEEHLFVSEGFYPCFDVGHANIASDAIDHAQKMKEEIFYVHIHDNHGVWDEHLGLGEGVAPWQEVIEILGERMYCFEPQAFNANLAKKNIALLRQITS